ncbi:membrane protein [Marinomonas ushuaiensis DSM 15871]|uniref:Membrane protein n=1 Tax=Marinomonas ushuaiensis DSM 15871 TaxID=1122207 RepID=X7E467_9GAMM|nr:DMT family transporter [Marinomonas ushuaiensis]ETX10752.1 membrane protein [Marinomonas ushuaiensis DSM 15871]
MTLSHLLLWLTAVIWGFAFVAQSIGMESLGPYSFNAARFTLAALSMLPLAYIFDRHRKSDLHLTLKAGGITGLILFSGATLQQIGLLYTTAANAGFITTMYMVFVPIIGLLLKHAISRNTWLGMLLALIGLYTLTVGPNLSIQYGDALELVGAIFWAGHVLIVGYYSRKVPIISFSIVQLVVVAMLSWIMALMTEQPTWQAIESSWLPLVYAGIASSAVAYTLQTIGQKNVAPSSAALILSTEAVFAAIGGWLLMSETLSQRELIGCVFIFIGIIISQWPQKNADIKIKVITS